MHPSRKKLVNLHFVHAVLFFILLLSGLVLFLPSIRVEFTDHRLAVRAFHIGIGGIYTLFLLYAWAPVWKYFFKLKILAPRLNLIWILFLALIWICSGWLLEWKGVPIPIRNVALWAHDITSILSVPWTIYHIITRMKRVRIWLEGKKEKEKDKDKFLPSRREFLFLLGGSVISFGIGYFAKWLSPISEGLSSNSLSWVRKGYFRIYTVTDENPKFDPKTWRLSVDGLVDTPFQISFAELQSFPTQKVTSDFHCVTGWSVYGVEWEGVLFRELAQRAKNHSNALFVNVYSADGQYVDSYHVDQLMEENVLLAWSLDNQPLSEKQGAPVRLVVPKLYGYKSVKWVNRIEWAASREPGYWEKRGYDLEGYLKEKGTT